MFHEGMPADAIAPMGECGYSTVYLPYDQARLSKMYLIVKNGQVRATYESPLSRRQVMVQSFNLNSYGYTGMSLRFPRLIFFRWPHRFMDVCSPSRVL